MTPKNKQKIELNHWRILTLKEKIKTLEIKNAKLAGTFKPEGPSIGQGWRRGWTPPNREAEAMAEDAMKRHAVDSPKVAKC